MRPLVDEVLYFFVQDRGTLVLVRECERLEGSALSTTLNCTRSRIVPVIMIL